MTKPVIVAGGTGFIGQALADALSASGREVQILSRRGADLAWDGATVGPWAAALEGAEAVINLSGESVIQRWTPENKKRILDSRVLSTRAIGEAISECKTPPRVWINASAVGYYGDTGDREVTEQSPAGEGFLAEVCSVWEAAAYEKDLPATRRVVVRIGFPLGQGGGLEELAKLARAFLGGAAGSGDQWMPWVHIDDLCAVFLWCLSGDFSGAVNGVGPSPVRNREFMAAVRAAVGRPWSPPAPTFAMKAVGALRGMQVDPVLESSRVLSAVLRDAGFEWSHREVGEAIRSVLNPR